MGLIFVFMKPHPVGRIPRCNKCKEIIERKEIFLRVWGFQSQGNLCKNCADKGFDGNGNYKKAYFILMEYWDSLPDEEKPKIDARLKKCGL